MIGPGSVYEGEVYRPPSEARSLILQATLGCSWNRCTFCGMYRNKRFRVRTLDELERDIDAVLPYYRHARRIFLADGNALCVPTADLVAILERLYERFCDLERVGVYGGPIDIHEKSDEELARLHDAGLGIVYLGLESGSAEVLERVKKGGTPQMMIDGARKVREAGIALSAIVINGLGGRELTEEHAVATGETLTAMAPDYIGCLTLMVHPRAPIAAAVDAGELTLLTPDEVLAELETMVEDLELDDDGGHETIFRANHASNYAPLRATLPQEKERLIREIRQRRSQRAFKPEWARGL